MEYEMKAGDIYRHFKGNRYEIVAVAEDCEDGSPQVVYKARYPPYKIYVRPYFDFVEELDKNKYPRAEQKHRFEKEEKTAGERKYFGNLPGLGDDEKAGKTILPGQTESVTSGEKQPEYAQFETEQPKYEQSKTVKPESEQPEIIKPEPEKPDRYTESGRISVERKVDQKLLLFLNGNTFEEQIAVLKEMRGKITDEMFAVMFASLDFPMPNGDEEARYSALMKRLETMHEFDGKRFRI